MTTCKAYERQRRDPGPPKYLAAVQLGSVSTTATLDLAVVDVARGEVVCEGRLSGAVDARVAGGVGRSIDQLLMRTLLPGQQPVR